MGNKKAINKKNSQIRSNNSEWEFVGTPRAVTTEEILATKLRRELKKAQKEAGWKRIR